MNNKIKTTFNFLFYNVILLSLCFTATCQNTFDDNYKFVLSEIRNIKIDSIEVAKGEKKTYEIDSFLVKDYSIDIIGCDKLNEFVKKSPELLTLFIFYEILLKENGNSEKAIANIYLMDLFSFKYIDYLVIYPNNNWLEFIPEANLILYKSRIELIESKYPNEIKEALNK